MTRPLGCRSRTERREAQRVGDDFELLALVGGGVLLAAILAVRVSARAGLPSLLLYLRDRRAARRVGDRRPVRRRRPRVRAGDLCPGAHPRRGRSDHRLGPGAAGDAARADAEHGRGRRRGHRDDAVRPLRARHGLGARGAARRGDLTHRLRRGLLGAAPGAAHVVDPRCAGGGVRAQRRPHAAAGHAGQHRRRWRSRVVRAAGHRGRRAGPRWHPRRSASARSARCWLSRAALPASGLYPLSVLAMCVVAWGGARGRARQRLRGRVRRRARSSATPTCRTGERPARSPRGSGWLAQIGLFVMLGLLMSPGRLTWWHIGAGLRGRGGAHLRGPTVVGGGVGTAAAGATAQPGSSCPGPGCVVRSRSCWPPSRLPRRSLERPTCSTWSSCWSSSTRWSRDPPSGWPPGCSASRRPAIRATSRSRRRRWTGSTPTCLHVSVAADSRMHGVEVGELRMPQGASISLVVRAGRSFVPSGRTRLQRDDELLVVAPRGIREATEARLRAVSLHGRLAGLAAGPRRPRRPVLTSASGVPVAGPLVGSVVSGTQTSCALLTVTCVRAPLPQAVVAVADHDVDTLVAEVGLVAYLDLALELLASTASPRPSPDRSRGSARTATCSRSGAFSAAPRSEPAVGEVVQRLGGQVVAAAGVVDVDDHLAAAQRAAVADLLGHAASAPWRTGRAAAR